MILSIIAVLFTFGIVIFLHEFGHFLVCKLAKIKVEAFSFGFGKELLGFTRGDTRYSVRAIPLGGYVKPAGEDPDNVTGHPDEYFAKPWYTRLGVVFAGPFMNYLLAFVLFTGIMYIVGRPVYSAVVGEVAKGMPAAAAGLLPGDRIVSVDGVKVQAWDDMAGLIHAKPDAQLTVGYERKGTTAELKLRTKTGTQPETGKPIGLIGVAPDQAAPAFYKKAGLRESLSFGAGQCYFWTAYTVSSLASNIKRREKPDISGPIGIVTIVSKAAHSGMAELFFLIALISVAVGFFNLLPIPLLDGGHAILFLAEGVFGRRLGPKAMGYVNSAGIAVLLSILLFATYNDIMRFVPASAAAPAPVAAEVPAAK
jgi:regulator of sigma E protease